MKNELRLADALQSLAKHKHQVLSGGTDYYPGLNDESPADKLLNIRNIPGLDQIELQNGVWRIGAGVTWSQLIPSDLPPCFNCLKQAGREVGSVQIQNAASVVGNICNASPAADGVPALLVLGAQVELSSVDGVRVLPLQDFITGVRQTQRQANELVTALLIPDQLEQEREYDSELDEVMRALEEDGSTSSFEEPVEEPPELAAHVQLEDNFLSIAAGPSLSKK